LIAHIVLFTPKADSTADELKSFAKAMLALIGQMPAIERAFIGKSVSIDPGYSRSMGQHTYSYAAVLEFADASALTDYLRHPSHAELGRMFWSICAEIAVIEVEGREPGAWTADELA
jgi:hypothetical protein